MSILLTIMWGYAEFLMGSAELDHWSTFAVPTLINLGVLIVFAIGIPNAVAIHAGEAVLARSLLVLWALRVILYPFERLLIFVEFIVRRLLGKAEVTEEQETERVEQEILEAVSEGELHGAVDEEQKAMIQSIFELHDTHVNAIMTPRTDIIAIPADAGFEEARDTIIRAGHSRLPVYERSVDHLIGVLYAKDLLHPDADNGFEIRKMMRTVPYVPETKTIDHLLREFRQERVHIAIVLDEYGGTAGLVTIEDIIEELVGEIDDEYDMNAPPMIKPIDGDTLEVDARVHIDEVNEELEIELPDDEDYETIGGFVFSELGKIPEKGEEFHYRNIHVVVLEAEPRRINRLRIHVTRDRAESA